MLVRFIIFHNALFIIELKVEKYHLKLVYLIHCQLMVTLEGSTVILPGYELSDPRVKLYIVCLEVLGTNPQRSLHVSQQMANIYHPSSFLKELLSKQDGILHGVSNYGWMEELQFYNWLVSGFTPHVEKIREEHNLPNQKAALLYDGHRSHLSIHIIEEALKHKIDLIKFPSHLTDKLQALNRCVFKPIKYKWGRKLVEYAKE